MYQVPPSLKIENFAKKFAFKLKFCIIRKKVEIKIKEKRQNFLNEAIIMFRFYLLKKQIFFLNY